MTYMVIPPEAVEAATRSLAKTFVTNPSVGGSKDFRIDATAALEAALPHLRPQQAKDSQRLLAEALGDIRGLRAESPHRTHGYDAGCSICKGSAEEIASALVFGGVVLADPGDTKEPS